MVTYLPHINNQFDSILQQWHSPHGKRFLKGGSEAARGDHSDLGGAVRCEDLGVLSGGALHAAQPHALAGHSLELAALLQEVLRAQEALLSSSSALRAT